MSKPEFGPLLARDMSDLEFEALDDPEMLASACISSFLRVSLSLGPCSLGTRVTLSLRHPTIQRLRFGVCFTFSSSKPEFGPLFARDTGDLEVEAPDDPETSFWRTFHLFLEFEVLDDPARHLDKQPPNPKDRL